MGLFDEIKDKLTGHHDEPAAAPAAPDVPQAAPDGGAGEMQAANQQAAIDRAIAENEAANKAAAEKEAADKAAADKAAADKAAADKAAAAKKAAEKRTYTVKSGDTLSGIAAKFGVKNYMDIAKANNIKNPDLIHPGQTFVIPD